MEEPKVVLVEALFAGKQYATAVWISDKVKSGLAEHAQTKDKKAGAFLKKLDYYAKAGFRNFEGEGCPIRHEGDGVYRIAQDLFRVIGFYEDDKKSVYIAVATFNKGGQKLSGPEREAIQKAAEIKEKKLWRRKDDGNYPRLA
ncbi:MAG TPA: hypothetical protein VIL86_03010 [Tepidisphaeraceae bacterium]|jgi:mRNA-degrading endonuclease RelE of RelBE toxin-antitoxin system